MVTSRRPTAFVPAAYLVGDEALDAARLTGLGVQSPRHGLHEAPDIHPTAIDAARRAGYDPRVILDLSRLDEWDRLRVLFARIAGRHYFDVRNHHVP